MRMMSAGAEGVYLLYSATRQQANFNENVPLAMLLLTVAELNGAPVRRFRCFKDRPSRLVLMRSHRLRIRLGSFTPLMVSSSVREL